MSYTSLVSYPFYCTFPLCFYLHQVFLTGSLNTQASSTMAGRGRGRGRGQLTFNMEAVGIGKGDALPPPTLQPSPLFPVSVCPAFQASQCPGWLGLTLDVSWAIMKPSSSCSSLSLCPRLTWVFSRQGGAYPGFSQSWRPSFQKAVLLPFSLLALRSAGAWD